MLDIRTSNVGLLLIGSMAAGVGFVLFSRIVLPTINNLTGGNG